MVLLDGLDAAYLEHRRCDGLNADVEGDHIWMSCECKAVLARIDEKEGVCGFLRQQRLERSRF